MEVKQKTIYFNNDDEFYAYSVIPKIFDVKYIGEDGVERYHTDFNFTPHYLNEVKNGTIFVIKDEDSNICKHGGVSYRTIFKEVPNLEPWFEELDE